MAKAKKGARAQRTPKTDESKYDKVSREPTTFIGRQRTRIAKIDRLLGSLGKELERIPAGVGWAGLALAGVHTANGAVSVILDGISVAPDNYEPPRVTSATTSIRTGDRVTIVEKFRANFANTLADVDDQVGLVKGFDGKRAMVNYVTVDGVTVRVLIAVRMLTKVAAEQLEIDFECGVESH